MMRGLTLTVLVFLGAGMSGQTVATRQRFDAFEVATIKLMPSDQKTARFITMQGTNRFIAKDYTLKLMIAAAYDLNPRTISGDPGWVESEHFDIAAVTPGEVKPTRVEQMAMLRGLLTDRFQLTFHREQKDFSIYILDVAKNGADLKLKLKPSTAPPDDPASLISTVYPQRLVLPARNATMADFASLLQRAIVDRPVVDKTGIVGRYDFDLEWAPDETQFGGELGAASAEAVAAPLFLAMQQQLGLRLEARKGPVSALVIDRAERPSAD